jgi:hypothetical protein
MLFFLWKKVFRYAQAIILPVYSKAFETCRNVAAMVEVALSFVLARRERHDTHMGTLFHRRKYLVMPSPNVNSFSSVQLKFIAGLISCLADRQSQDGEERPNAWDATASAYCAEPPDYAVANSPCIKRCAHSTHASLICGVFPHKADIDSDRGHCSRSL